MGYSHVQVYRDVPQKWVSFHRKSLHMGPIFVEKKSLEVGLLLPKKKRKKEKKIVNSAIFDVKNVDPNLQKSQKKNKKQKKRKEKRNKKEKKKEEKRKENRKSALVEKSLLDIGRGF